MTSPAVLEFVNSRDLARLAAMGTSCPDHFLRTKIAPLVVPFDPVAKNLDTAISGLDKALEAYRADYATYYDRCKRSDSPAMRDPNAVVYLVPGVGMITFAKDKATARIAGEFYVNAINVMRGAALVDTYVGLAGAGGLRHRVLAPGGGEAPAHAQAEASRRARGARHRRGRRHRQARSAVRGCCREGACAVLADIDAGGAGDRNAGGTSRKAFGRRSWWRTVQ